MVCNIIYLIATIQMLRWMVTKQNTEKRTIAYWSMSDVTYLRLTWWYCAIRCLAVQRQECGAGLWIVQNLISQVDGPCWKLPIRDRSPQSDRLFPEETACHSFISSNISNRPCFLWFWSCVFTRKIGLDLCTVVNCPQVAGDHESCGQVEPV